MQSSGECQARLYDYFRAHYENLSNDCQDILDHHLFDMLKHLHLQQGEVIHGGEVQVEALKLNQSLKRRIIEFMVDYCAGYERKFSSLTGVQSTARPQKAWDGILSNLDLFLNRFTKQVSDAAIDSKDGHQFNDLFPAEKRKGRFHARLKTLCYMELLYASNAIVMEVIHQRGMEAEIVDETGVTTVSSDLKFNLKVPKADLDSYLWTEGQIPPSHFGSHEIVLPHFDS